MPDIHFETSKRLRHLRFKKLPDQSELKVIWRLGAAAVWICPLEGDKSAAPVAAQHIDPVLSQGTDHGSLFYFLHVFITGQMQN